MKLVNMLWVLPRITLRSTKTCCLWKLWNFMLLSHIWSYGWWFFYHFPMKTVHVYCEHWWEILWWSNSNKFSHYVVGGVIVLREGYYRTSWLNNVTRINLKIIFHRSPLWVYLKKKKNEEIFFMKYQQRSNSHRKCF